MEKVKEVLRLHELGFCQREIHRHLGIARSCIQRYLMKFESSMLTYDLVKAISDSELKGLLKCKKIGRKSKTVSREPDFEYILKELTRRKGTTLELLWVEWSSQVSNSYGYSSFCRKYREWSKEQNANSTLNPNT
jgi:transposase